MEMEMVAAAVVAVRLKWPLYKFEQPKHERKRTKGYVNNLQKVCEGVSQCVRMSIHVAATHAREHVRVDTSAGATDAHADTGRSCLCVCVCPSLPVGYVIMRVKLQAC